jgi:hypothetical protein
MTTLIDEQAQIVSLLAPLLDAREAKNAASKDDEQFTPRVRQFLELNWDSLDHNSKGAPVLVDHEHDVIAYLASRKETGWNVSKMPDDLVVWLARAGLLTVATKAFDDRRKNDPDIHLDDALRYRTEGESYSLRVERVK